MKPSLDPICKACGRPLHRIERRCLYCGERFTAGIGTGRRYDAKYCCDEHRVAYLSKARSAP